MAGQRDCGMSRHKASHQHPSNRRLEQASCNWNLPLPKLQAGSAIVLVLVRGNILRVVCLSQEKFIETNWLEC